jgi:putative DNA primase/helicase
MLRHTPDPIQRQTFKLAVRQAVRAYERSGRMVDAAFAYAAAGFPVVPLDPRSKVPIPPRDPDPTGKFKDGIPASGGVYKACVDRERIRRWWWERPWALIGMPMGQRSGVWALDADSPVDHPHDGIGNWAALLQQRGAVIKTREHLTTSDGLHLIFNWYAERPIRCGKGDLPKGIEVKGQGGYIAVPPSRRKRRHYIVTRDINPTDAPQWLIEIILQGRTEKFVDGPSNPFIEYGNEVEFDLDELADAMRFVPNDDLDWDGWKRHRPGIVCCDWR